MTRNDVLRLAGEAQVDPGTVRRYLSGSKVRAASVRVIADAAARLGININAPAAGATGETRAA